MSYYSCKLRREPPQTVAIEVEPSDAITSELMRTVYGKSSSGGKTASKAFSARVPRNDEDSIHKIWVRKSFRCIGTLVTINCGARLSKF